MRISVGHSAEQDTRAAASRAATTAAEGIEGLPASLAVLLVSAEHGDRAGVALDAVRDVLEPDALVGCVTDGLVAGNREVESGPAIAVWVASLPDRAETFHMEFVRTSSGGLLAGYHFTRARGDFHLLLADPYTFPADLLLEHLNAHLPGTLVMGGLVGGGRGPRGSVLFCDDKVLNSGAVGVRLPGWQGVPVVSQGCRPIGEPYTVTGADTGMLSGLGGRPPLERLRDAVATLPAEQHELARHGVQLGIVVDEYLEEPSRGDFLIRAILGVDESTGALRVGEDVAVGDTVRFQIRDAAGADEDLRENLRRARARLAGRPAGALLFTCNGRGRGMFAVADHDAGAISDVLGDIPLAGYFAAGEMGPVGGRNALHGYTASLALFDDR